MHSASLKRSATRRPTAGPGDAEPPGEPRSALSSDITPHPSTPALGSPQTVGTLLRPGHERSGRRKRSVTRLLRADGGCPDVGQRRAELLAGADPELSEH